MIIFVVLLLLAAYCWGMGFITALYVMTPKLPSLSDEEKRRKSCLKELYPNRKYPEDGDPKV